MEEGGGDADLIENLEYLNLASDSQLYQTFPDDDVVALAPQGQPLQNDDTLENRNLVQNQGQLQATSPPFENMHLNPNDNYYFNEPANPPPRYQLNAEQVISSNRLPSYQNQYRSRPPSQPSANVASSSRGCIRTNANTSNINSTSYSASEPMQHNMQSFVRNARMRVGPGQGRPGVVPDSSNTAQQNMVFPRPNPNPGQPANTLSYPFAGSSNNPGHPASNYYYVPFHTLSFPQARPNPYPADPMGCYFLIPLARPNSNPGVPMPNHYLSTPPARPNTNPDHPICNYALASNCTLSIPQARPNPNPNPYHWMANHALSIPQAIPHPNSDHWMANHALASNTLSIPQARPAHPMANRALAASTLSFPLDGGRFVPRVGTNMSPMQIPITSTAQAPVLAAEPRVPVSSVSPMASVFVPSHTASQNRSQGFSRHQAVPATPTGQTSSDSPAPSVFVPIHAASQDRSREHQLVPATPSARASNSQLRNRGALAVAERPRSYRLPRDSSRRLQEWVRVQESNVTRRTQNLRNRASEMFNDWRQMDRHLDMRLDTDNMTHEELMELGERIGYVNTGVSEEILNERMIQRSFSDLLANGSETCCICLEEYGETDEMAILDCGHDFHRECIKKWLGRRNTCPICKKPGIGPKKDKG